MICCDFHRAFPSRALVWTAAIVLALLPGVWNAGAHQLSAIAGELTISWDRTFVLEVSLNIEASPDPEVNDAISADQVALDFLRDGVRAQFDDGNLFAPDFGPLEWVDLSETYPDQAFDFTQAVSRSGGRIPRGAEAMFLQLSPESEVALVLRVVKGTKPDRRAHTLFAGEYTRPIDLTFLSQPPSTSDPFAVENAPPPPSVGEGFRAGLAELTGEQARRALVLGGLFLLATRFGHFAGQAAALWGAAFFGQLLMWWSQFAVRPALGAFLVAMALISVAVDNILRQESDRQRWLVAAGAGLLLGMATRAVAYERAFAALSGFYAGLLVATVVLGLVFWAVLGGFWRREWYRRSVVRPVSYLLLGAGLFWAVTAWRGM